jgi:hypothetical protein
VIKVFEPTEIELADSRGDPSRVVEIQKLVDELLKANRQRQEGIKQAIREEGAWALPGLINATTVWMSKLDNQPAQQLLAGLMTDVSRDNEAATKLLFQTGVIGTPFPIPREVALSALDGLNWRPTPEDVQKLRQAILRARQSDDAVTLLHLYRLLLRSGEEQDRRAATEQCKDFVQRRLTQAGDLLALLVNAYPDQIASILTTIILNAKAERREEPLAISLTEPLRPIPTEWLTNNILVQASVDILRQLTPPRHTTLEYLWMAAVRDGKRQLAQEWSAAINAIGQTVQATQNPTLYRYWFRALDGANEIDYLIRQAQGGSEQWSILAVVELFFLAKRNQIAKRSLVEIRSNHVVAYERAEQMYEELQSKAKDQGVVHVDHGTTTLTNKAR